MTNLFQLGPAVVERLRSFEVAYDGPCEHDHADQWAPVSALRSRCIDCWRDEGSVAPWERPGSCDSCNRAMPVAAPMTWAVPTAVDVIAVVRLCADCAQKEVLAVGGPEPEGEEMMRMPLTELTGRSWPAIVASGEEVPVSCRGCFTKVRRAATTTAFAGVPIRLHGECRDGLSAWARAANGRDTATLTRAERIANARATLAIAGAAVTR